MTSAATTVDYTFEWPSGPEDVVVTGEFDEWKGTMPLLKTSSGDFELTFPVKIPAGKEKVFFKFIVDGSWVTSDAYSKGSDENGIENNYISRTEAVALSENPMGTKIPEAGGLVFGKSSFGSDEDAVPEPGAYPRTLVDRKSEEVEGSVKEAPKPTIPAATGVAHIQESPSEETADVEKPAKVEATGSSIPEPTTTTSAPKPEPASLATAVKTTEAEEVKAPKEPAKPEPAAIPSVAIETTESDEAKASETPYEPLGKNLDSNPTITSPPNPAEYTAVPEVTGSTTAVKGTSLEPMPTSSSSDSKKRFKIKRRIKKNKATGEKTIVSEERVPLDSEESASEQPIVDEELVASPTETAGDEVHIMPIDVPADVKNTDFKPLAGEPGLVVPANAAEIKEFSEIRDVDVDELNERLNKEEKKKEAPTLDPNTHQNELEQKTSNKLYEVANGESAKGVDIAEKSAVPEAAAPAKESGAPAKESGAPTTEKSGSSKTEKKPAIKPSPTVTKQEEKKKKGGFFSKLKKILH